MFLLFPLIIVCGCRHLPEEIPSVSVSSVVKTSATTTTALPDRHIISDVPLICQFPAYPTGCETVASVMALRYVGEQVSVDTFIDNCLETGAVYRKNGVLYGPDPYEKFVGDPRSQYSLGCFSPVMEKALKKYLGDDTRVIHTTGQTVDSLCRTYIAQNIPVIVWVSIQMKETGKGNVWYTETGERFRWITNEHCMLLIGFDETQYYFNDPYTGKQLHFEKSLVSRRYDTFGKQSIVVLP